MCDTHDHVFALTICPTDSRTEKHSPSLTQNIVAYSEVWRRAQQKHADKVSLIDVHAFISSQPDFHHWLLEDGHHITPGTHQWIASEIMRRLEQRWQRGGSPPP